MEGFAIAYGIGPCSINNALIKIREYLDHKKEFPDMDDPSSVATIYGLGGQHRYYLRPDGTIRFSTFHMGFKDVSKDAESLGFIID